MYADKESTWHCKECGSVVGWTWEDVQDAGTPVCEECDRDMELDAAATFGLDNAVRQS